MHSFDAEIMCSAIGYSNDVAMLKIHTTLVIIIPSKQSSPVSPVGQTHMPVAIHTWLLHITALTYCCIYNCWHCKSECHNYYYTTHENSAN